MNARRAMVWLIGGAAGCGKSEVAYPLARKLGVPLVEIDDIVEALKAITTPQQQPVLHYWQTHPEAARLPPEEIVALHIAVTEVMAPAIEAVIGNHLETGTAVVIEGDYLVPSLAARHDFAGQGASGRVRAVFLREPDEGQLVRNFGAREVAEAPQTDRARVSRLFDEWLGAEAERLHLAAIPARPWSTIMERTLNALEAEA